jgi:TRAP-type C4-dicarboxylate transport system permease small subunit
MSHDAILDAGAPTDVPRHGLLGAIQRPLDLINALMAVLSSLALGLAGAVLTWEVIGRYFLERASDWQDEMSTFLLIGATFASAAWTQARRGHVAIDALAHVLSPAANRVRRVLADAFSFLFCAYFSFKAFQLLHEAIVDGQTTDSAWGPPLWIPYGCMAVGMALLAVQQALQTLAGPSTAAEFVEPMADAPPSKGESATV